MSTQIASLYAEIGAKIDGFQSGAGQVKSGLTSLSSDVAKTTGQFNGDFKNAILGGKANMQSFGVSLLDQADKAGLSTEQMQKLTGATGIYSDTQQKVAASTVNVAAKAEQLSIAVKNGEMSAEEAGVAFQAYAKSQEVSALASMSLQDVMMIGIPIILAVAGALYETEKAADAAARGDARLEAVIKSTGEAAGYNFQQLDDMAQGLSHLTGIDDDVIKKSEAVQLTFTNIGHNIFPQVTKAALDLSAVLGTDLQGATIQVDKALNDFSGYTALKRAGVSFSDEQIKQIKNFKATNDLAGYQKLILGELTKEFGGAAAAIHNAGDKSEDVAIAWGNLTENAGGGLVPALRGVNVYLTASIDGWNKFFTGLQKADNQVSHSIQGLIDWGIAASGPIGWVAKWISVTGQQMDAQNVLTQSVNASTEAVNNAASANQAYIPTAEEVDAANKAISDGNTAMVGTIQSMQDAEESYTQKLGDLTQQRMDAEQKRQEALAKDGADTDQINSDYQNKLSDISKQEADMADARDKQTLQFISNILLQKLEVDGFTTAEFDAFAKQQEAWGLWSADTVEKAQAAWAEADKVSASIAAIPTEKTSTITTVHNDVYDHLANGLSGPVAPPGWGDGSAGGGQFDNGYSTSGGASEYAARFGSGQLDQSIVTQMGGWDNFNNWSNWQSGYSSGSGHAIGGSFMIPNSYGNEGFRMGNGDTASGGEMITVTPANKQGNNQGFEIDYDRMARAFRDALQELGR